MHPMMKDWLDELTNGYLADRKSEARRFLDVANRTTPGRWSIHGREGFETVRALAVKLVRGEVV